MRNEQREFERTNIVTLSDGSIWRYANIGNMWHCITGELHDHFATAPVRADRTPLTADDELAVKKAKHISRLCTMMPLDAARADWESRNAQTGDTTR